MEHRIFGRELTNLLDQGHLRAKRNYSFLHQDRQKDQKPILTARNRSVILPPQPHLDLKSELPNPQMVPQYFEENFSYLRSLENSHPPLGNYIIGHRTVSENSRSKLIDWLTELHYKYKMFPQTIFTVVALLDRFLAIRAVPLAQLQLVGISALMIAAKFEETYQVPQLRQLVSACAGQYKESQVLAMEAEMLHAFNFELIVNSAYKFFEPLAKIAGLEPKNIHLGQYVLELVLTKPKFLQYSASMLAASTIYLIKKIRKAENAWSEGLSKIIGYRESELKSCAKELCTLLQEAPSLDNCKALKKKFSLPSFHQVTRIKLQRKDSKK